MRYARTLTLFIAFINITACTDNLEEDMRFFQSSLGNQGQTAADFRAASFNVWLTFGDAAKKAAIEKHVVRGNADIQTFTETSAADFTYVQAQYAQYGYTDFRQATGSANFLLMMMSKYPITYSTSVVGGGFNALYCEVLINGYTVGVLSAHTYPDCISAPCRDSNDDPISEPSGWNRTIQLYNYAEFLNDRIVANPAVSGFILQGDLNEDVLWNSPDRYTEFEPGGYAKPSFLSYPIPRGSYPNDILTWYSGQITIAPMFDLAGDKATIWAFLPNTALNLASEIDYITYTDDLQVLQTEILNSEVDGTGGMVKSGAVLDFDDSRAASDHLFIMADFKITPPAIPPNTTTPAGNASVNVIADNIWVANEPAQSNRWYGRAVMKDVGNNVWACTYINAKSHIDTEECVVMIKFSDDYGETWSAENKYLDGSAVTGFPMHPPGAGVGDAEGAVEGYLMVMPNGDLIVSMWKANFGATNSGTYQSRSIDGGRSWDTPTLVNWINAPGADTDIFMTDDDFVIGGVIYSGARWHTTAPAESAGVSMLFKSLNNGQTWQYVSSLNDAVINPQIEFGMEYVGDNVIVAHGRGVSTNCYGSHLFISTDKGQTWTTTTPANLQTLGRQRIKTRSHVKGTDDWWDDPVLISHGFDNPDAPLCRPRRLCIYVSKDKGATWSAALYLKVEGNDGGYGDFLWNPIKEEYVTIQYYAPTSYFDGELRQINWELNFI